MSAASVLSQLRSLFEKSDHLIPKLDRIYPTEEQWDNMRDLSAKLAATATTIQQRIRTLEQSRADRAWKESEGLRSHALACKGDILANGRLKQSPVFRRNIVTIFEGPKDSKFDTEDIKTRKVTTRQRCAQIRLLSPDGIISWAVAFAPSLWAGGSMATDIFKCLLDDVEPDCHPSWPLVVRDTLHTLLEDEEALQGSLEYRKLLKAYDTPSGTGLQSHKKRKRLGDHYEPCPLPLLNASNTNETFRNAFVANPAGLMKEVFLVCNAAYSMQAVIDSLRASTTTTIRDMEDLQTRLENTLISKSDGDATIARLMAENEAYLKIIQSKELHTAHQNTLILRPSPERTHASAEFLQHLELKLEMNKDWWNSEPQRMGYVVSCLKGKAHDQVRYNIKDGVVLFDDVNAIKSTLQSAFGDIDAKATAQLKIFDMKQGHRSLTTFLPEWYAVAKLTDWDSGALIAHLRRALHDNVIWRLSH
ncbi:reverse transcriptase [Hirsutella rhossiliensis]|uniref:Reverse transcriptase n=1 Tax=Hirsutella rhossiliensis TaxID=111463 RepID=A0A9P8MXG5_9HYPO|nr:reverse transcriptase [Hirsutella rhossiliensis]KAH0962066.1 reverse transcriptase [Hirsutella rhossiliensis]